LSLDTIEVDGKTVPILLQPPPSARVASRLRISPNRPFLDFCVLMKPEAFDKCDGVGFLLELRKDDRIEKLFSATLSPKTRPDDRKPLFARIDLRKYAGQEVELLYSTDASPTGANSHDRAGWARVRFTPGDRDVQAISPFEEIYDKEVKIFEVPSVLPRAAVFYGVETLSDEAEILNRLKDPSHDIYKNTLVWETPLSDGDRSRVENLRSTPQREAAPARIVSYRSRRVVIEATADAPALLKLNDANYPGWKVYVNGKREAILNVDFLFRGVLLQPGANVVEFVYEPRSFKAGAAVSLIALLAGTIPFVLRARRRRGSAKRPA
jgi:hypothetical protein